MAAHLTRRRVARWKLTALGAADVGYVVQTLIPIVIWRSRWQPGIDALRRFMKRFGNRKEVQRAGTPGSRTTAVHHVGRTTGCEYVTPVWGERVGDRFYIHLPYGTGTDWCKNVLAAGGCVLVHNGVRLVTRAPTLLPAAEARPLLPRATRTMQSIIDAQYYLRLAIESSDPAPAR